MNITEKDITAWLDAEDVARKTTKLVTTKQITTELEALDYVKNFGPHLKSVPENLKTAKGDVVPLASLVTNDRREFVYE